MGKVCFILIDHGGDSPVVQFDFGKEQVYHFKKCFYVF